MIAFDSGGYGALTITIAVSVIGAPGAHVALTSSGASGVDVSAGANDSVTIRGLNVTMTGSGIGIGGFAFGALSIENCSVKGGTWGVWISGASGSSATVVDTAVRNATLDGFVILSHTTMVRCRSEKNAEHGLSVREGTGVDGVASAVDFVSAGNAANGVNVQCGTAAHHPTLSLDHALISNNVGHGVAVIVITGGATVRVTNCTVTDNQGNGYFQGGASTLSSMNNNLVGGNVGGDVNGTVTLATLH